MKLHVELRVGRGARLVTADLRIKGAAPFPDLGTPRGDLLLSIWRDLLLEEGLAGRPGSLVWRHWKPDSDGGLLVLAFAARSGWSL